MRHFGIVVHRNRIAFQFTHPGKGAADATQRRMCSACGFNSRTLGRVRLGGIIKIEELTTFQFTHPGKGATRPKPCTPRRARGFNSRTLGRVRRQHVQGFSWSWRVSIHAPWEGCDFSTLFKFQRLTPFQFTHPGKGATTAPIAPKTVIYGFNSRTLGRVRLPCTLAAFLYRRVSIHAPWEGCDSVCATTSSASTRFNSRTLGRVRRYHC